MRRLNFAVSAAALALLGCGASPTPRPFDRFAPHAAPSRLVVVGDLQRTAPVLEAWREQNDPERERVVAAIAATRPDLLAITGDCVFDGGSDAQWGAFDQLMRPVHEAGIPALLAFGNHEYWLGRGGAEAHVFPRFPVDDARHAFAIVFGPLRLVVLDSNEGLLSDTEWAFQRSWYEQTLDDFDRDPAVRGVLVLLHHPPYTNSTITGDEPQVQRDFVPAFLRAKKTLAMLSGHVHSYERYLRGGKMFVVSGGGGGPRAELRTGTARRHTDDLFEGPALRDFHFTVYTLTDGGVDAVVRGLPKGGAVFHDMDHFTMPYAP